MLPRPWRLARKLSPGTMVSMSRAYLLLLLISAASGQTATEASDKAPPKVEAALRARVSRFYQLEVEGKFRQVEPLVAEESKDFFYAANKPRYAGFSIKRIEFSDDFKRATVVVLVNRLLPVPGFEGQAVPGAVPSHWKLEKGAWCWYADRSDMGALPFPGSVPRMGNMPAPGGVPMPTGPVGGAAASLPPMPNMTALVLADKATVELKPSGPSSAQVTLVNQLKTPVTLLTRDPNVAGLSLELDRADLKAGEKAILNVRSTGANPVPAQPVTVALVVKQTNQVISIKVAFSAAAKQ
jgi:hypothetical protein